MTRLALVGGAGRMGQTMAEELVSLGDFSIAALIDPTSPQSKFGATHLSVIEQLNPSDVDVVIDFSVAAVARTTLEWCLLRSVPVVVGTSGLATAELNEWKSRYDAAGAPGVIAANFSIGAVLAERFAAQAAPYFDAVEIIELHHDKKVDAPSGTSIATANAVSSAREAAGREEIVDPTERETLAHARGAAPGGGVRIHSVRLPGLIAHQEVLFGRPGEGLTIRHDSFDRRSFAAGVALAARRVPSMPGMLIGISELV